MSCDRIVKFSTNNDLRNIYDKNGNTLAHLPMIDIRFSIQDPENNGRFERVVFSIDGLKDFIGGLNDALNEAKKSAMAYKIKLGDKVFYFGDEF